ncbi:MAG: hypothetical protein OK457_01785 [Thaumarchaeota archaeon]|nr:hypothetical protein [Nitrososphaerota archaeon]
MPELEIQVQEQRSVKWYRLAEEVLGESLLAHLDDASIVNRVSGNEILIFPLPAEETKEQTSNRPDPVIYVIDREGDETLQLGLECNTLKSVAKLRNILDAYHAGEKSEFLKCLLAVDDGFQTLVYTKLKPHNFAESPEYRADLKVQSNAINEAEIDRIFSLVDAIRQSGVEWRLKEGLSHPPEVPSIDIVCTQVAREEEPFKRKLDQIKALFEITLRVKNDSELRKAKVGTEKNKPKVTKILCTSCKIEYSHEQYQESRFCRTCKNHMTFVQVNE